MHAHRALCSDDGLSYARHTDGSTKYGRMARRSSTSTAQGSRPVAHGAVRHIRAMDMRVWARTPRCVAMPSPENPITRTRNARAKSRRTQGATGRARQAPCTNSAKEGLRRGRDPISSA